MAAGVATGIFALLFATANDRWVLISLPTTPWHTEPSFPAFEARLWAVMLVSFLAGAILVGGIALFLFAASKNKDRGPWRR